MITTRMVRGGAGIVVATALAAIQAGAAGGQTGRVVGPTRKTAAPARCQRKALDITLTAASGGLTHQGSVIEFRNRGGACTIMGYPGVDALNAAGQRVLSAKRVKSGYLGGVESGPIPKVHLAKGQTASALLEWIDLGITVPPGAILPDHSAERRHIRGFVPEVAEIADSMPRGGSSRRFRDKRAKTLSAHWLGRRGVLMSKRSFALMVVLAGVFGSSAVAFGQSTKARAASTPTCATSSLRLDKIGEDDYTSHRGWIFALRNVGSRTCQLRGFPAVHLLDANARVVATTMVHFGVPRIPSSWLRGGERTSPRCTLSADPVRRPCLPTGWESPRREPPRAWRGTRVGLTSAAQVRPW